MTRRFSRQIEDLKHHDASRRRSAADALSNAGEGAVYLLIKALSDENPGVQDAAMRSLISIGGEVTAYMILPLLRSTPFLRNTAVIILREIGREVVPLLNPLITDKDEDVRKFALDLICEIKHCDYPHKIARVLINDPNPNVRTSAAKAIGVLNYKEALPRLIDALKDDEWVCIAALESLALMKEDSSIEPIISLLDNPSVVVRHVAIETLGKIGSMKCCDVLLGHISKSEGIEKTAAIKSLLEIGVTPSMPGVSDTLIGMFKNGDWDERLLALKGLSDMKEERAIYPIIDIAGSLDLSDPESEDKLSVIKGNLIKFGCTDVFLDILVDPSIKYRGRMLAVEIIGDLKYKKAIPYLNKLLEGKINGVRRASVRALGEMNSSDDTRQAMIHAIDDTDGHVRRTAITALGRIGDRESINLIMSLLNGEKYKDVIEEAIKALLMIDPQALFSRLNEMEDHVKEIIGKHAKDVDILLPLSQDKKLQVRISAISGLGRIRDERSFRRLKEVIHDAEPEVRKAAVIGMGELNCCHEEVKSALNDGDMWVRLYAVKALGCSQSEDMIELLIPMLDDKDAPVVLYTIDTIAKAWGRKALDILTPLTNHSNREIGEKVQQVIDNILLSEAVD